MFKVTFLNNGEILFNNFNSSDKDLTFHLGDYKFYFIVRIIYGVYKEDQDLDFFSKISGDTEVLEY